MLTSTDQLGQELLLENYPKRVVSLVPSITELLYDIGMGESVVGITKFCIFPNEWYRSKTRIGGTKSIDIAKVLSLKPDLIIANKEENVKEQVLALSKKCPTWVADVKTFQDALQMIALLGTVLNKDKEAKILLKRILLAKSNFSLPPVQTCAYLIWKDPMMVAGGDTFIHSMLEVAGFQNVFANLDRYPSVSLSELSTAAPEYLLLSSEPFPFKEKHLAGFSRRFPKQKTVLVDGTYFSWYGSRLEQAFSYFQKLRS